MSQDMRKESEQWIELEKKSSCHIITAFLKMPVLLSLPTIRGFPCRISMSFGTKWQMSVARSKVTKNRLVKLALAGTPNESVSEFFSGPTAIAFSEDPVAAPKVAAKFAKENDNLKIVGGIMGR
jgi:ribosomal protein L10